jgi:hypothetical protein
MHSSSSSLARLSTQLQHIKYPSINQTGRIRVSTNETRLLTNHIEIVSLTFYVSFLAVAVKDEYPSSSSPSLQGTIRRSLKGRFLHITDMHPDPYYRKGASESSGCHRKKPKKEKRRAGEYGIAYRWVVLLFSFSLPWCGLLWLADAPGGCRFECVLFSGFARWCARVKFARESSIHRLTPAAVNEPHFLLYSCRCCARHIPLLICPSPS